MGNCIPQSAPNAPKVPPVVLTSRRHLPDYCFFEMAPVASSSEQAVLQHEEDDSLTWRHYTFNDLLVNSLPTGALSMAAYKAGQARRTMNLVVGAYSRQLFELCQQPYRKPGLARRLFYRLHDRLYESALRGPVLVRPCSTLPEAYSGSSLGPIDDPIYNNLYLPIQPNIETLASIQATFPNIAQFNIVIGEMARYAIPEVVGELRKLYRPSELQISLWDYEADRDGSFIARYQDEHNL